MNLKNRVEALEKQADPLKQYIESLNDDELHELLDEIEQRLKALGSTFDATIAPSSKAAKSFGNTAVVVKKPNRNKKQIKVP